MPIETLAIGDEILAGKISDTNSTEVALGLFDQGRRLVRQTVIPDDEKLIQETIGDISKRATSTVCFGGLGPTSDDKTAETIAKLLHCELLIHEPSREKLFAYYQKRSRAVTSHSLKQVQYPATSQPFLNQCGMAPGFHLLIGACHFYFLPGVPTEMRPMFFNQVLPHLIEREKSEGGDSILAHTWRCIGPWESELQGLMDPIEKELGSNGWIGYRTQYPENHVTLYVWERSVSNRKLFENLEIKVAAILSGTFYGEGDQSLEGNVIAALKEKNLTLALAESCTGGLVSHRITRIPGASDHFWGSLVCYQKASKERLLSIHSHDPVSQQCSREMAESVKKLSGCDITAGITGFMGPSGDPIGSVYLCVLGKKISEKNLSLPNRKREQLQWGAASFLLKEILEEVK